MSSKNVFLKNGINSIFYHEISPEVWLVRGETVILVLLIFGEKELTKLDNCANVTD